MLHVNSAGTGLERDGRFFPLLVDTVWAAFADVAEADWPVYLAVRRRQGFTALLTTVLPIVHDRVEGRDSRYPYARRPDGTFDYGRPDDAYLDHAADYVRAARDRGLEVIVAVTWANYLPGTWAARLAPDVVMPPDVLRDHVTRVARALGPLGPIFAIGGDDGYDSPAANALYHDVIGQLRDLAPGCLVTAHAAPNARVPDDLQSRFDLHLYQSGHDVTLQASAWEQAERLAALRPRRPVVNVEPAYEWHGRVHGAGRWRPAEVRAATWSGILAGAGAGLGYGAHGVWMWATGEGDFLLGSASLEPATWVEAMAFPGVADVALAGHLIARHRLDRLAAAPDLLPGVPDPAFRAGATPTRDRLAFYLPYDRPVRVAADLAARDVVAWDLARRVPFAPDVTSADGQSVLRPTGVPEDALVLAAAPEVPQWATASQAPSAGRQPEHQGDE